MAVRSLALSLVFLNWLSTAAESPLTAEQQAQLKERDELVRRAEALKTEGKYDEALAAAGKALELTGAIRGPEHVEVGDALERLAALHELTGQLDAAVKVRQEALALREKLDGDKHWRTADARLALEFVRKAVDLPEVARIEVVAALRQEQQAGRLEQQGKFKEAEGAANAAQTGYRKHLGDSAAAARALHRLARTRYKQGNLKGCKETTEQALALRRKVLPPEHPDIAASLNNLGVVQSDLGDYAAARRSHEEALAMRRKALPKDNPYIAASLNNLGIVQHDLRDYAAARRSHEQALAIRRKALPKDHPDIAMSLNNLGVVQHELRDYAAARRSHEQALAIRRKALPKDHPDIAMSLNNLGLVQHHLGDYAQARRSHEEALAIYRKALPAGDPRIANSLNNLGVVQDDLRDYVAARRSHEEALAIRRAALPKDHPDIATSLNNLGIVQSHLRDYVAARRSHEEALAIYRKALPKDHPDLAMSLTHLGVVQWHLRDYVAGRRSHEEALAIYRQALPKDHPDIASSLNNLGIVQSDLRDYVAARRSYEEALAIKRKALPKDHPDIAKSLSNLGNVQSHLRDYAAARRSHEEALAIFRQTLPKDHPDIAKSLNNLGNAQWELRDYAAALRSHEEALAIFRQTLPKDHPDIAKSLNNLGAVQQEMRDYVAARRSYEEALAIYRKALPKDHPLIATSLHSLGLLCLESGDEPQTTFPLLAEAVAIRQQELSRLALAQAEAEQFHAAAEFRSALDLLLSVAAPPEPHPGNDRYAAVVGFKGAVTARQRWARRGRQLADPEAARLLRQLQQANSQLLAAALADRPSNSTEDLRELSERRARLERELAALSPSYRRFLQQGSRTPADIRAALPPGTALLDCLDYLHRSAPAKGEHDLRYEPRLVVFVVRPDRTGVVKVPLGSSERLADLIDRWRASHGRGKTPSADQPDPATELRKLLWEPLEKHLDGVKVVLVSPDGPLNGLPLAALPGREPGKFLVHHYAFAVVPVPQLLPDLLADKPRTPREQTTLLLAGGIDFGEVQRGLKTESGRLPPLPSFADLPGSASEVNDLRGQFEDAFAKAPPPVLLRKDKATKAAFLLAAPKAHYLHLATHGFFANEAEKSALDPAERASLLRGSLGLRAEVSGRHPGLLSGVVFAGVNDPEHKPDEAVLTALEASELDLEGAELVTLSACDTGRGAVAGGEGVLGLQRALQLSGARSVLASLWKVPDEETHRLMREFYKRLWSEKPLAKAEALRQAQLWLLEHGAARSGLEPPERAGPPSPYVWAAFILSGDWR
jgi:CHAT domain-containing protein/Tfp pilus assembly protein PilF